jgi:hypothetical protein
VLCALPAALFASYACIGIDRGIVPTRRMQASAVRIAELFGARWVVMGHTHEPVDSPLPSGARYVNLGHWGEDDVPEERDQHRTTTCTYLHVRLDGADEFGAPARLDAGGYRADLMRWKACSLFDQKKPCGAEANMAKYLAAKASWEAANVCLQTHGGFGFAAEYDVERKFRETRLYQVAPISTNLILSYVAEHVLGLPRSY